LVYVKWPIEWSKIEVGRAGNRYLYTHLIETDVEFSGTKNWSILPMSVPSENVIPVREKTDYFDDKP
jgi:hypothetical protein